MQLRYFVDLGYQPVVAELIPDPPFPKSVNDTSEEGVVYSGSEFLLLLSLQKL